MSINVWPVDAVGGVPSNTGRAIRETIAPLVAGATTARPLGARSGVRPGTSMATVTATSTTWTCKPHAGILDLQAAAEAGPYSYAVNANVTGSVDAANATNPRKDIIYAQISDPAESDGSSVPGVAIGYLAGTAAGTPSPPDAPSRSLVLAEINVPLSGGGSPSVTWVAPYAVGAGGVMPAQTLALLNLTTGGKGEYASVTDDTDVLKRGLYSWNGSAWVQVLVDTGWITFGSGGSTIVSGWTVGPAAPAYLAAAWRLLNGVIHVSGNVNKSSGTINADDSCLRLPVGARPTRAVEISARQGAVTNTAWVATDGTITFVVAGAGSAILSGQIAR